MAAHKGPAGLRPRCTRSRDTSLPVYLSTNNTNIQPFANCTLTHKLYVLFSRSQYRTAIGADHMKTADQRSFQHYFCSLLLSLYELLQCYPQMLSKHSPSHTCRSKGKNSRLWYQVNMGATTKPSGRKCYINKCPRPVTAVRQRTIMLGNEWV
jgi:hypothetical protein